MECPICGLQGGFHIGRCHEYSPTPELVGPGNSKEFMAWQKERKRLSNPANWTDQEFHEVLEFAEARLADQKTGTP